VDEAALAVDLAARDHRDSTRAVAPLRPAADAELLDTTDIGLDDVVRRMEAVARARLAG
jgi:cytidylate kinase